LSIHSFGLDDGLHRKKKKTRNRLQSLNSGITKWETIPLKFEGEMMVPEKTFKEKAWTI